jgi:lysozyme
MTSRLKAGGMLGGVTALGIATAAYVGAFEGKRNHAYQDIVGVWTVCYGETRGVKRGMYKTDAECNAMLADGLVEFEQGMRKCLKHPDVIPNGAYKVMISTAWNIGTGAFCKSSIARKANVGDLRGACNAIGLYNRAGGKVVKGLVSRRTKEVADCLASLKRAA